MKLLTIIPIWAKAQDIYYDYDGSGENYEYENSNVNARNRVSAGSDFDVTEKEIQEAKENLKLEFEGSGMTNKDLIGTFSFETGGYSYEDGQAIAELLDEYGRAKKPVRKPTKKPTKKPSKKPTKKPTKKPKTVKPKTTTTTTTSTTTRTTTPEPTTTEILTTSFTTTSTTVATKKVSFSDQFAFLAAGNSQNANGAFGLFGNSKEAQEQERGKKNKNKKSNKNQVVGSYDNYQNYFQAQLKNEEDFSCWTCSRSYWEKDSTGDMYADCRTHGEMITCPKQKEDLGSDHFSSANSCQVTERRFFGIVTELHVGCKQTRACQANFNQNKMNGSVYGRSCRPESTFGISTCRQCCSASECYSDSTILAESFNTEAEWLDDTHHATLITV